MNVSKFSTKTSISSNYVGSNYHSNKRFTGDDTISISIAISDAVTKLNSSVNSESSKGQYLTSHSWKQDNKECRNVRNGVSTDVEVDHQSIGKKNCDNTLHILRSISTSFSSSLPLDVCASDSSSSNSAFGLSQGLGLEERTCQRHDRQCEQTEVTNLGQMNHNQLQCHLLLDRESLLRAPPIYLDSRLVALALAHSSKSNHGWEGDSVPAHCPPLSCVPSSSLLPPSPTMTELEGEDLFISRSELSTTARDSDRLRVLHSISSSNCLQLSFRKIPSCCNSIGRIYDRNIGAVNHDCNDLYEIYIRDGCVAGNSNVQEDTHKRVSEKCKNIGCDGFLIESEEVGDLLQFILRGIARNIPPPSTSDTAAVHTSTSPLLLLPATIVQWLSMQVRWVVWTLGALERRFPGKKIIVATLLPFFQPQMRLSLTK